MASGWEAVAIARELANTGHFANPFQTGPSGPTAIIPPLYPVFLAALIKVFGDTPTFAVFTTGLTAVALALHSALLPGVSQALFGNRRPGIIAGVFSVFAFQLMPQWDVMFTCCALLLFVLYADLQTPRTATLTGVAFGLLLLTNPATVLVTGPWLLTKKRPDLQGTGLALAAILLTTLPWMWRNTQTLGTFSIKNNLGFTLYVSNADCVQSTLDDGPASACLSERNPNKSATELALLRQVGETRYDARRREDALRWIRTNPEAFLRLTRGRIAAFWFPPRATPWYTTITIWLVTALSLPGLVLITWRRGPSALFLLGVTVLYPALYYLVVVDIRYRYPILWISLLAAGYLLSQFAPVCYHLSKSLRPTRPRRRD